MQFTQHALGKGVRRFFVLCSPPRSFDRLRYARIPARIDASWSQALSLC